MTPPFHFFSPLFQKLMNHAKKKIKKKLRNLVEKNLAKGNFSDVPSGYEKGKREELFLVTCRWRN